MSPVSTIVIHNRQSLGRRALMAVPVSFLGYVAARVTLHEAVVLQLRGGAQEVAPGLLHGLHATLEVIRSAANRGV